MTEHPATGLTCECWGHAGVFGVVPLSGAQTYWYATRPSAEPDARPAAGDARQVLRECFGSWADPIPELIERTPADRILRHALCDRPPRRGWSKGSTTRQLDASVKPASFARR